MLERRARASERRFQVLENLLRLGADVAFANDRARRVSGIDRAGVDRLRQPRRDQSRS
jgi:hypothetical protein